MFGSFQGNRCQEEALDEGVGVTKLRGAEG